MGPELTHTRLLVDDYPACFRFYRDAFGMDPTFGDESSGYADFDTGDVTLALFDAAELADAIGTDPPPESPADGSMLVFRVEDVDAAFDRLADEAAVVAAPADHPEWGIRTAHLRDPDGTLLELNEPIPE